MSFIGDTDLYNLGARLRGEVQGPERLQQALRDEDDLDEFYHLFGHEVCYAQVWSRDALSREERALAIFTMIAALGPRSGALRVHTRGVIRSGGTRAQLRQVLAMLTWYAGNPIGAQATETVREALKDIQDPGAQRHPQTVVPVPAADLLARGRELRLKVLGESRRDSAAGSAHEAHERLLDSHYFGVLWSNTDLTLKQRCLVLLAILCGANRLDDASTWFAAALRLGYKPDELEEFVLCVGVYCGELTYSCVRRALLSAQEAGGASP